MSEALQREELRELQLGSAGLRLQSMHVLAHGRCGVVGRSAGLLGCPHGTPPGLRRRAARSGDRRPTSPAFASPLQRAATHDQDGVFRRLPGLRVGHAPAPGGGRGEGGGAPAAALPELRRAALPREPLLQLLSAGCWAPGLGRRWWTRWRCPTPLARWSRSRCRWRPSPTRRGHRTTWRWAATCAWWRRRQQRRAKNGDGPTGRGGGGVGAGVGLCCGARCCVCLLGHCSVAPAWWRVEWGTVALRQTACRCTGNLCTSIGPTRLSYSAPGPFTFELRAHQLAPSVGKTNSQHGPGFSQLSKPENASWVGLSASAMH
jgi:hypothetical protein